MKRLLKCHMKPYIQPFERILALAELQALAGGEVLPTGSKPNPGEEFAVESLRPPKELARKLSYWESVVGGSRHFTLQVLREATVNAARNGLPIEEIQVKLPFPGQEQSVPLPNRRCLRYGTHGIHEYRGKFFPQLVRALLNIARVPRGGVVADPMCGSGTTLVEAVLAGCKAVGLDANPLSVALSRAKCSVLKTDPEALVGVYKDVRNELLSRRANRKPSALAYFSRLGQRDQEYLRAWFSDQVLADLDTIAHAIDATKHETLRQFLRISLSNILRNVSWQKADDLRVRKEVRSDVQTDPIRDFLEEMGRSVRLLLAFLRQNNGAEVGSFQVDDGDARDMSIYWRRWTGKVDAIVTSPPYATALPYIDTDRLSLCYLKLLSRPEHRKRDLLMIGNREVTERTRADYWKSFEDNRHLLPESVVQIILEIDNLNRYSGVGFRRHNLPALLSKYFFDMRRVLEGMLDALKPGAPVNIVVGSNHTVTGGRRVEIETARLLGDIARTVGFQQRPSLAMEMLISRDIFKKNAGNREVLLELRRPN